MKRPDSTFLIIEKLTKIITEVYNYVIKKMKLFRMS